MSKTVAILLVLCLTFANANTYKKRGLQAPVANTSTSSGNAHASTSGSSSGSTHASGSIGVHVGGSTSGSATGSTHSSGSSNSGSSSSSGHASGSIGVHVGGSTSGSATGSTHSSGSSHSGSSTHASGSIGGSTSGSATGSTHSSGTSHSGSSSSSGHASGSIGVHIGGSTSGSATGSTHSSGSSHSGSSSSSGHASAGVHIKVSVKTSAKSLPSTWSKGLRCQASFGNAWNATMLQASQRGAVYNHAQNCLKALYTLKSQMACAACDNNNSSGLSSSFKVKAESVKGFQEQCASFLSIYSGYLNMVNLIATYADAVSSNTTTQSVLSHLDGLKNAGPNVTACQKSGTATSTTTPNANGSTASSSNSSHSSSETTTTPATNSSSTTHRRMHFVKRSLQAIQPTQPTIQTVDITNDSWTNWRKNFSSSYAWEASASPECLASAGIKAMTDSFVFGNTSSDFKYFNGLYAGLDALYTILGNSKAQASWASFKGRVLVTSWPGSSSTSTASNRRRAQSVQPTASPTLVIDATNGVTLTSYTKTGLTQPSTFSGDNQTDLSGKLVKSLGVIALVLSLIFN